MAPAVVDALEVVDVQRQQQRRLAAARHTVNLARQRQVESPAVGQAGQRVAAGQLDQRIDHALQPGGAARRAFGQRLARMPKQLQSAFELKR